MRINRFIAQATGLSRRAADRVIEAGKVTVNDTIAQAGTQVSLQDTVLFDGKAIKLPEQATTILLNKPAGYVCSRDGQGSQTVYDLLPETLHELKPVGRLDKYSSGLLLLTNDGELAQQLTHPKFQKTKIYEVILNKALQPLHRQMIAEIGIQLEDGPSKLDLERLKEGNDQVWRVIMHEGRNRQIRRTFSSLDYGVAKLHRIQFGTYTLHHLASGKFEVL